MYDVIIVGGGTAGLTAAVYSARAGKKVLVLEGEAVGGQINYSPRVENYPGIASISGAAFADSLCEQALAAGAELEPETVTGAVKNADGTFTVTAEDSETFDARALILATGTRHKKLGIAREDELSGKGVSYCAVCDGAFYKGKVVTVVGGGSAALQSAELLCGICERVYLVHRRDAFRGEDSLVRRLQSRSNLTFVLNSVIDSLLGADELTGITVRDVRSGEIRTLPCEGLFVSVGQIPQNAPFASLAALDESGYLLAGEDCRTTTEGVFAAGDCRKKQVRQLTTAAADGAVAALAAGQM